MVWRNVCTFAPRARARVHIASHARYFCLPVHYDGAIMSSEEYALRSQWCQTGLLEVFWGERHTSIFLYTQYHTIWFARNVLVCAMTHAHRRTAVYAIQRFVYSTVLTVQLLAHGTSSSILTPGAGFG